MSKDEKRAQAREALRDELEGRLEDVAYAAVGLLCDIIKGKKRIIFETRPLDGDRGFTTELLIVDDPTAASAAEGV